MKKIITFATALLFGLSAVADDFNLYYDAAAGTEGNKIESVANLQKITFENGNIVATRKDGTSTTLAISAVKRLFFSTDDTVNAIEEVQKDPLTLQKGEVYDLTGRKLNVDLNKDQLPKGIYMVDGKKILIK